MLHEFGHEIGYENRIIVFSEQDRLDVFNEITRRMGLSDILSKKAGMDAYQWFGATGELPDPQSDLYPIFNLYLAKLREWGCLCFAMILYETRRLLSESPKAYEHYHDKFKYIFVDEFQDSDLIQYNLHNLLKPDNMFAVGDDYQCWHSDSKINTGHGQVTVKRFINGKAETIIKTKPGLSSAKHHYVGKKKMVLIRTKSGNETRLTLDHKIFATHPDMSSGKYYLYLMFRSDRGYRLGVMTGGKNATIHYRTQLERAEKLWLVYSSNLKVEVYQKERLLSLKYQIPTTPFELNGRGIQIDPEGIKEIFRLFGMNGEFLIRDMMPHSIIYPHFVAQGTTRFKRSHAPVYLYSNYSSRHQILVSHEQNRKRTRKVFNGPFSYNKAWNYAVGVAREVDSFICEKFCCNGEKLNLIPAGTLFKSSMIPIVCNGELSLDEVVEIEDIGYHDCYHISMPETGVVVADGIVSHNSIYGFRHADIGIILGFEDNHPGSEAIKLQQNFRSTNQIVMAGKNLISHNPNQIHKDLFSRRHGEMWEHHELIDVVDESEWIVKSVESLIKIDGYEPKDIAILYRMHSQAPPISDFMERYEIPHNVVKPTKSFWESEEIRGVLSVLSVALNPNDDHHFKMAMNFPVERMDKLKQSKLARRSREAELSLYQTTIDPEIWESDGIKELVYTIESLEKYIPERTALEVITRCINLLDIKKWYLDHMLTTRLENLDELLTIAKDWMIENLDRGEPVSIGNFMDWVNIQGVEQQSQINEEKNEVTMCTIHAAKGLEWTCVVVAGVAEGVFPHKRASLAEERRLFYVAITRAKDRLIITNPKSRQNFGKITEHRPSRFIDEMLTAKGKK